MTPLTPLSSAKRSSSSASLYAARLERLDREFERGFYQPHRPERVGLRMADGVGGHVRQHQIGRAAELGDQPFGGGVVHEVHLEDRRAVDRIDRQQVDPHHRGLGQAAADDLGPASRRDAQIEDTLRALEEVELLVELDQLVGRAAAVAFGPGLLDVRIVELPLEPAHRRRGAPAAGLDPPVGVLARAGHQVLPRRGRGTAPRLGVADSGIREGILRSLMAAEAEGAQARATLKRGRNGT